MVALIGVAVLVVVVTVILFGIYVKNTNAICESSKQLDGRTALVTGGTSGMGLELARELAGRGARVLVAGPCAEEGARALRSLGPQRAEFHRLDLACLQSTRRFAAHILGSERRLDLLVNNAGVGGPSTGATRDALNFVVQVNYYGAFLLTLLLLPLLRSSGRAGEPSRIVNVSSLLHRLSIPNIGKDSKFILKAYADSKLYLILFSRELTKRLKNSNVVINNSDPGAVGTGIFGTAVGRIGWVVTFLFYMFSKTPWQGAQTTLHVALDEKAAEVSGEYFKECKLVRAGRRAYDDKTAMKLWEESVRLVKLTDQELEQCFKST